MDGTSTIPRDHSNLALHLNKFAAFKSERSSDTSGKHRTIYFGKNQDILNHPQSQKIIEWVCHQVELNQIQVIILTETLQGKTYQHIAENTSYNFSYIKDLGHKLWRQLSDIFGQTVTKHNFRAVILNQYHSSEAKTIRLRSTVPSKSLVPYSSQEHGAQEFHDSSSTDNFSVIKNLRGRHSELTTLNQWIILQRVQLLGIFGIAGCGKTTLARQCIESINHNFEKVIWRSLRDLPDFKDFLYSLLSTLEDNNSIDGVADINALLSRLLTHFENSRILLVLDDWSSIFQDNVLAGIYNTKAKKYGLLLRRISERTHKSCIILTSREKPSGLVFTDSNLNCNLHIKYLQLTGLLMNDALQALSDFGLLESDLAHLEQLVAYYSGNPFALKFASNTVSQIFNGDLSAFLDQESLIYGEIKRLLISQVDRISDVEKSLLMFCSQQPQSFLLPELLKKVSIDYSFIDCLEGFESLLNRSFIIKKDDMFQVPQVFQHALLQYNG